MAEDKPRLARLTAIITQLQTQRIVTANDIAKRHHVSIRTVYRDIRTLEKSGIPIITEEGKGYSLVEGYKLPPVMFSEEEASALVTAEQLILKNKDLSLIEQYQNAVMKVKSVLKTGQKARAEFLSRRLQVRTNPNAEKTSNHLIMLQSAIAHFRVVQLDYLSLDERSSERKVEPFALYTTRENWVLIAFCKKRRDFRAFRLDRIRDLQATNQHFEPHQITLEQYLEQCRKKRKDTPDIPLT